MPSDSRCLAPLPMQGALSTISLLCRRHLLRPQTSIESIQGHLRRSVHSTQSAAHSIAEILFPKRLELARRGPAACANWEIHTRARLPIERHSIGLQDREPAV